MDNFTLSVPSRQTLKKLLITHEGVKLKPYSDIAGKITIGVGRNLNDKGITTEEAMILLDDDIMQCEHDLMTKIDFYGDLNDCRKIAMIDLCFNLGIYGLLKFERMLDALRKKDYKLASDELLASSAANKLKSRYQQLAHLLETGIV